MAKSTLDIVIRCINNGLVTPNEVRALENLDLMFDKKPVEKSHAYEKITCEHCSRPNQIGVELCESCGAPLKYSSRHDLPVSVIRI